MSIMSTLQRFLLLCTRCLQINEPLEHVNREGKMGILFSQISNDP
jgi:hypothetical protein